MKLRLLLVMLAMASCKSSGSGGFGTEGSGADGGVLLFPEHPHDGATSVDAAEKADAPGTVSGTGSGTDGDEDAGNPMAGEDEWLTQMNAARAAVGEQPLTWDPIAAQVAMTYAGMCDYMHNPNASSQYAALGGGNGGLGENIAAGTMETPQGAVAAWLAEEGSYDHATNSCGVGADCGHYTQIVWSTTTGVGCAQVECSVNSPFGGGAWQYSVCDFSPPGNVVGEAPY